MESKAVHLLNSVLIADYAKTREIVNSIISLASLMVDSGLLNAVNREVLIRESESIYLAIQALPKEHEEKEILPDLNLNKVFSKSTSPIKRQIADKQEKQTVQSETVQNQSAIADETVADEIADKSETRQSAIIEKLRQTENCRLNELQAIFPEVSERTLRYDLESLISRGLVERVGSRRNSFYKIKNEKSAIIELPGHLTASPLLRQ